MRSWRLRERLSRKERFRPVEVLDIHRDTVNPARRELVRLGLHLRDTHQGGLSEGAGHALAVLEPWLRSGASSDLKTDGAELATRISTFFRMMATPLAFKHGGGESGLVKFLKEASARMQVDPKAKFDAEECRFLDQVLAQAWAGQGDRAEPTGRTLNRRGLAPRQTVGWFDSLDGFGSLDRAQDLAPPGITCLDGQTIHSQAAQSYTQWVPLHDVDLAQTVCPMGHSDRPDGRYRTSTMSLWGRAALHPAPVSRKAVEKIAVERMRLVPYSAGVDRPGQERRPNHAGGVSAGAKQGERLGPVGAQRPIGRLGLESDPAGPVAARGLDRVLLRRYRGGSVRQEDRRGPAQL